MIWFWRGVVIFSLLNLINLFIYDGGAGMEPVWIGIIIGSLILSCKKAYMYFFSKRWFKSLMIGGLIILSMVECLIIINGIELGNEKMTDYLIVLGARVKGDEPSLTLQYRLDKAYEYLIQHPNTRVVLSGGQGPGEDITEAEAMKRYLQEKGLSASRMIMEDQSTDTVENLRNAFTLIDKEKENATITIVTSRFHVLRSKMIARDLGKKVEGIGAQTLPFLIPNYYLREFFAVVVEFFI